MKQILQSFKTGLTELAEVPVPMVSKGKLLIKTTHSLVSIGTERMLVEFGKSNLVSKALQQPERVKMVLDKIKSDGLLPTIETVFNKLEQPLPLGYCNAGIVMEIGEGVNGFSIGDRVASNGLHAEYVCVPQNLTVKIPANVSLEEATFTVIGSIGLQGIRLCAPTFGETFVVIGLGLIGLLTAQLFIANGCKVIGIDIDNDKCSLAKKWGVFTINPSDGSDPVKVVLETTSGVGADGVLITASTKTNDIISQSAQMSRKRGRIVLIGVIGLDINRTEFYEKELTFQVSCSYGPGRYDDNYENKGIDYPLAFVRWSEKRNFEAILQAINRGNLNVKELITEIIELENFQKIYGQISKSKSIASIFKYPVLVDENIVAVAQHTLELSNAKFDRVRGVVGIIGAGNFTKMTMLPALKGSGAGLKYIASSSGVTSTFLAKKFGFKCSTTDYKQILSDNEVDIVIITTKHNSHAKFVTEALRANKHVFVEKPLALNEEQLKQIIDVYNEVIGVKSLMVGFNRRFSPHMQAIKKSLAYNPGPVNLNLTMNAGFIPKEVWVHDMSIGGGRIIGEACHYMDLVVFLTGSEIISVCANSMGENPASNADNVSILLKLKNGSNSVVNYFANGSKAYSKERVEVYSRERIWITDNFRTTRAFGVKGFKNLRTKIDKGHKVQFHNYISGIQKGGEPLIPFSEIVNVTKASFAAIQSLREKRWIDIL
jgi:predicted dehydrogenase/threonine dehydrogenase-like Zn-dependent dehydrogenase